MDPLSAPLRASARRPIDPRATRRRATAASGRFAHLARLGLVTALLLAAGCGTEPDLLTFGARELPGTADADYLAARPFSVAPDGSMLVFASRLAPERLDGDPLELDQARLASFRLLDLDSGGQVALPALPRALDDDLARYGLLHVAPCWHRDSRTLLFHTTSRAYFQFGPLYADPGWSLVREPPPDLDPGCGERTGPISTDRRVGRFRVERAGGDALEVRHADTPGVLFEVQPEGATTQVTVADAKPSPAGDRLAIVYSRGLGSFTGKAHAAVVTARAGEPPLHPLGSGVLVVAWIDDRRLVGYARPDGRRAYALYTWTIGPGHAG